MYTLVADKPCELRTSPKILTNPFLRRTGSPRGEPGKVVEKIGDDDESPHHDQTEGGEAGFLPPRPTLPDSPDTQHEKQRVGDHLTSSCSL